MLRIGIVWIGPRTLPYWVVFDQRMHELGYVEGENLTVEFLDLNGRIEGFDEGMKELIRRKVDIIIALGAEAPEGGHDGDANHSNCRSGNRL